jgi:hypothetical protein
VSTIRADRPLSAPQPPAAAPEVLPSPNRPGRRPRRSRGIRGLAVGYRFMAWQALRRGDTIGAAMHAACSRSLRRRRQ